MSRYFHYQQIQKQPEKVTEIEFKLFQEDIDSCFKLGLNFAQFHNLVSFSFIMTFKDSVFESFVIERLKMNKNLLTLKLETNFQQDFSGFENIKSLHLDETTANNESILAFKNVEHLSIVSDNKTLLTKNSPAFKLNSIVRLGVTTKDQNFPFEAFSQFEKLEAIGVRCDTMQIPESWKSIKKLKRFDGDYCVIKSIPAFLCDLQTFEALYISMVFDTKIPICLFKREDAHIEIEYLTKKKSELRELRRYVKRIRKDLPPTRQLIISNRNILIATRKYR